MWGGVQAGQGRPRHEEGRSHRQALTVLALPFALFLPAALQPGGCWHLHFTDGKTEARRCGQAGDQQNWDWTSPSWSVQSPLSAMPLGPFRS